MNTLTGLPWWLSRERICLLVQETQKTWIGSLGGGVGAWRSPGGGNDNPLQYSCLKNSMVRWSWGAIVHGVTKSWTQLNDYTCTNTLTVSSRHKCLGRLGKIREKGLCSQWGGTIWKKRKIQEAECEKDQRFIRNKNWGEKTVELKPLGDPKHPGDWSCQRS